jgi:hypothetical protein
MVLIVQIYADFIQILSVEIRLIPILLRVHPWSNQTTQSCVKEPHFRNASIFSFVSLSKGSKLRANL